MALFSVVVPVYNAAKTIERCVDSIIKSGGADVQVVLVEDCSKDDSWAVCQALAAKYDNVLAFHNEQNRGVSFTRNRALQNATGEYVLFVDSDDWVDETYVPTFREAVKQEISLAICGYVNHDEKHSGRTDAVVWEEGEDDRILPLRSELKTLHERCLLQQLWNKVFVNAFIKQHEVRFDESISIGEDTRFILDYIDRAQVESALFINRPLYHYMRDQDGSLMFRVGYESVEEPLKNLRTLYRLIGHSAEQVEALVAEEREKQIKSYAYLIMHNAGMAKAEKKRLILALDKEQGPHLYRQNRRLYQKEKLMKLLK